MEYDQEDQQMSDLEMEQYLRSLGAGTSPSFEEKFGVHKFLDGVAKSKDTTKLGNLNETELGTPRLPLRTLKELAVFCKDVANMGFASDYFAKKAEILTSTSLSKDAKLIGLSVMQRREVSQKLRVRKPKKRWFGKDEEKETEEQ